MADLMPPQPQHISFGDQPLPKLDSLGEDDHVQPQSNVFNFPSGGAFQAKDSQADYSGSGGDLPLPPPNPRSHKRSRTSINKLPEFTFNPGASAEPGDSAQQNPSQPGGLDPLHSFSPGRHRRSASELSGGHVGPRPSYPSPAKVDRIAPVDGFPHKSDAPSERKGHRHRRSEARASQDILPSIVQLQATKLPSKPLQGDVGLAEAVQPSIPRLKITNDLFFENTHSSLQVAPLGPSEAQSSLLRRPESAISAPRPLSQVSTESGSSSSTVKNAPDVVPVVTKLAPSFASDTSEPKTSSNQQWTSQDTSGWPGDFHGDKVEHTPQNNEVSSPDVTDVKGLQLDENFDEDPTSTIVLDDGSDYGEVGHEPTASSPYKSRLDDDVNEVSFIDLDLATAPVNAESSQGNLQLRSFQNARRSMHSNAVMSGFMGPGMHYHRRTESAPLLAPVIYERHFDGSASEKGFEMEDVFEEEDEDDECNSPRSVTFREAEPDILDVNTGAESNADMPDSQAAYENDLSGHALMTSSTRKLGGSDPHEEIYTLNPPQAPFMTPDTLSNASFISQKYPGSSGPSSRFAQSADDVPSLMSGSSTGGSAGNSHYPTGTTASPALEASASASSLAKTQQLRRKARASVVSLSRLIGVGYPEDRLEVDQRCQSVDDGLAQKRKTRFRGPKRLFKLFKGKEKAAE